MSRIAGPAKTAAARTQTPALAIARELARPVHLLDAARATAARPDTGVPLAPATRAQVEPVLGFDFSEVRVHHDSRDAEALRARAFTSNRHIWFAPAHSPRDTRLLVHELTHVVQQATGEADGLRGAAGGLPQRAALEGRAREAARRWTAERDPTAQRRPLPPSRAATPVVQFDFETDALAELHRMSPEDTEALAARRARLRQLFAALGPVDARSLRERLRIRRRGDRLSERFHDLLATATRRQLLGILTRTINQPESTTPSYGDVLRAREALPIAGVVADHLDYADRAFQGIASAPLGTDYTLYRRYEGGHGTGGVSVPKLEFHLDADPLTGFVVTENRVYRDRATAEAVIAGLRRYTPDAQFVTFYMRGGVIFPTTLSESTVPVLIHNLRRVRERERADLRATADLAEALMWWYIGARLPVRVRGGGGAPLAREAARDAARVAPAVVAFDAARVAEELLASTRAIANPGQRMIAAARQLSAMTGPSAAQKAQVMLEFFRNIGFAISRAGVVDDGARLLMYSEDSRYAFAFIKNTGEILYARFNMQTLEYVWQALR